MLAFALFTSALVVQAAEEPTESCPYRPVFFASGSAAIDRDGAAALDMFLESYAREMAPSSRYTVTAATDSPGSSAANLALSRRRAQAVAAYLVARGFPRDRLSLDAIGEDGQIDPAPGASAVNRRAWVTHLMPQAEWRRRFGNVLC